MVLLAGPRQAGKTTLEIIEVKNSNHLISGSLRYFHEKYDLHANQAVKELKRKKIENGIEVVHALKFLKRLDL